MATIKIENKRITVLDALRGFALLGVILMHMLQSFGIQSLPNDNDFLVFTTLDSYSQWFGTNVIMGRFINIFALLFGLSFFIQLDNSKGKELSFNASFSLRMVFLFLLGLLIHSFFNIEILSIYALFGVVLLWIKKATNFVLILIATFFLAGGPRIIQSTQHNAKVSTEVVTDQSTTDRQQRSREHIENPSFINTVKNNYTERLNSKFTYQFGMIGRGFVTLSLFVIGFLVGRTRFFEHLEQYKKRSMNLFFIFLGTFLVVTIVLNFLPEVNTRLLFYPDNNPISSMIILVKTLEDIAMVLSSCFISLGFILLYQTNTFNRFLDLLSPYGRAALTNYTLQGIFGVLIFAPWAFDNTVGSWGSFALLILGVLIYILQIIVSKAYLKSYYYGPLEWLWRSVTYLKMQPLKKPSN